MNEEYEYITSCMAWFFLTITAVFFIVIETIFEKKTLAQARSLEFAALFAFGNVLVLLPFLLVADMSQVTLPVLGVIFLASIPSAVASFLIFKTIKHSQLSEAAPILALSPLVATLFAYILLGEKMTTLHFVGLLLIVGGMIVLEFKNFKFKGGLFLVGRGRYIVYILLYLLLGGIGVIFERVLLFHLSINPLAYLLCIQAFIAVNFALFLFARKSPWKNLTGNISQYWKVILFISILTVAHRYLHASAIQIAASVGMVVAIYRLSALFHVFSGGRFFAEEGILRKSVASVIILAGTAFLLVK